MIMLLNMISAALFTLCAGIQLRDIMNGEGSWLLFILYILCATGYGIIAYYFSKK